MSEPTFLQELERLINKHNAESLSNTPDFILAQYIADCLAAFNEATHSREKWYGRLPAPLEPPPQFKAEPWTCPRCHSGLILNPDDRFCPCCLAQPTPFHKPSTTEQTQFPRGAPNLGATSLQKSNEQAMDYTVAPGLPPAVFNPAVDRSDSADSLSQTVPQSQTENPRHRQHGEHKPIVTEVRADPICPKCGGRQGYPNSMTHHGAVKPCWCSNTPPHEEDAGPRGVA